MLLYSVALKDAERPGSPLAVVSQILPRDIGAISKIATDDAVNFITGEGKIVVTRKADRLFIDAPYRQETVGVAWQLLLALALVNPAAIWLNAQTYDEGSLKRSGIRATPLCIRDTE